MSIYWLEIREYGQSGTSIEIEAGTHGEAGREARKILDEDYGKANLRRAYLTVEDGDVGITVMEFAVHPGTADPVGASRA